MATQWLLKFIVVLLRYLDKYSPKLIEIADHLPQSLYQYKQSLESITPDIEVKKMVVCPKCESHYMLKACFRKVGFNTVIKQCYLLIKSVISNWWRKWSGNTRFYPHKIYCYVSLISSLQNLMLRRGFIEQCESTRNFFLLAIKYLMCMMEQSGETSRHDNTPFLSSHNS